MLLLNASASSSFGTNSKKIYHGHDTTGSSLDRVPFVYGGGIQGTAGSKLFASVDTPPTATMDVSASNLELLSERGRKAVVGLIESDVNGAQRHVYADWPEAGVDDEGKIRLAEQVGSLHIASSSGTLYYTGVPLLSLSRFMSQPVGRLG